MLKYVLTFNAIHVKSYLALKYIILCFRCLKVRLMNGIIHTHPHIPASAYEYWTKSLNVIEHIKTKFNLGCEQK